MEEMVRYINLMKNQTFEQIATRLGDVPSVGYPMWVTPDGLSDMVLIILLIFRLVNWKVDHSSTGWWLSCH